MIQGTKKWIISQLEQTLDEDGYYAVEVMSPGAKHTRGQQDRFYKICRNLAEETGYSLEEMKAVLMTECFGEPRHTSELTTKEMGELIDLSQRIAAEQGIYDER